MDEGIFIEGRKTTLENGEGGNRRGNFVDQLIFVLFADVAVGDNFVVEIGEIFFAHRVQNVVQVGLGKASAFGSRRRDFGTFLGRTEGIEVVLVTV